MNKITRYASGFFIFLAVLSCSKKAETDDRAAQAKADEAPSYVIGFASHSSADKFMTYLYDAVDKYDAEHDDVVFNRTDANEDSKRQLDDVDNFIVDGVDALLLIPTNPENVLAVGLKTSKAGIPLIVANREGREDGMKFVQTYVGSQEEDAGRIQIEQAAKLSGAKGKIGILMGRIGHAGQIGRTKGVESVIAAKYPDMEVLVKQTGEWDRAKGLAVTQDWLQAYPEMNMILANNDEMAIGALLAAQKSNLSDEDLIIGGVDATPDALDFFGKGLDFSVYQSAKGQGRGSAEAAHRWAKGESPDKLIWIPFELVTADNADNYR